MNENLLRYSKKYNILDGNSDHSVDLVLHLHDELLYEVPLQNVRPILKILKHSMENCIQLSIPLKVKLKTGQNWGELSEVVLEK